MWHCDHTNHECPPKATVLYARTLPKKGGDTCVASMYRGLDALPADLRARLDDMVSVNSLEPDTPTYSSDDRAKYTGGVRHPMVRTHPETGRKALFFHLTKSQAIDGMADEEVRPFLEDLLDRSVQPEWAYCHKWTLGDLLILDNRCTMHRADPDYDQTEERLLWRIILEGDRPV